MASEQACLVKQQNKLLRVDLKTGDLQQLNLPLHNNMKRRSPDCQMMVGEKDANFFAYDIGKPEPVILPKAEGRISDIQWLNNDGCAFIVAGKQVMAFDRKANKLEAVASLPFDCQKIAFPSLDGRYVFCIGQKGFVLVDTQTKTAEHLGIEADNIGWLSNDTLFYSRELPDMKQRGTWIKTVAANLSAFLRSLIWWATTSQRPWRC